MTASSRRSVCSRWSCSPSRPPTAPDRPARHAAQAVHFDPSRRIRCSSACMPAPATMAPANVHAAECTDRVRLSRGHARRPHSAGRASASSTPSTRSSASPRSTTSPPPPARSHSARMSMVARRHLRHLVRRLRLAIMALLRHPDVFHAARRRRRSPTGATTTPSTPSATCTRRRTTPRLRRGLGHEYVDNLRGRLMLFYGTADNNVHPNNSHAAHSRAAEAGKSFEVQVGPDRGARGASTSSA
jgi:hypothetical protein